MLHPTLPVPAHAEAASPQGAHRRLTDSNEPQGKEGGDNHAHKNEVRCAAGHTTRTKRQKTNESTCKQMTWMTIAARCVMIRSVGCAGVEPLPPAVASVSQSEAVAWAAGCTVCTGVHSLTQHNLTPRILNAPIPRLGTRLTQYVTQPDLHVPLSPAKTTPSD